MLAERLARAHMHVFFLYPLGAPPTRDRTEYADYGARLLLLAPHRILVDPAPADGAAVRSAAHCRPVHTCMSGEGVYTVRRAGQNRKGTEYMYTRRTRPPFHSVCAVPTTCMVHDKRRSSRPGWPSARSELQDIVVECAHELSHSSLNLSSRHACKHAHALKVGALLIWGGGGCCLCLRSSASAF